LWLVSRHEINRVAELSWAQLFSLDVCKINVCFDDKLELVGALFYRFRFWLTLANMVGTNEPLVVARGVGEPSVIVMTWPAPGPGVNRIKQIPDRELNSLKNDLLWAGRVTVPCLLWLPVDGCPAKFVA